MSQIREPIKKTSIAKKQKIIEKGFELICNKGYHHVNCADIAQYAGVSTGSIYQYFSNKKDILVAGINEYLTKIMFPIINIQANLITKDELIEQLINASIKNHKKYKIQHEELVALVHQDKELSNLYQQKEWEITKEIKQYLENDKIYITNSLEKIHIIILLIDNLSHELIYHHHKGLQEKILKEETKKIITSLLYEK